MITVFQDGDNTPEGLTEILASWSSDWKAKYSSEGELEFAAGVNLKDSKNHATLPKKLQKIYAIRNPDLYFADVQNDIELGGVEITTHSPDGSNIEKRYPYIWASRKYSVGSIVATPYSKTRSKTQVNKIPFRISSRNIKMLREWEPKNKLSHCNQIIAVRELQGQGVNAIPPEIDPFLISWKDIGEYFSDLLASNLSVGKAFETSVDGLNKFKKKLDELARTSLNATRYRQAASLYKDGKRWIQIYNSRPDSGHWERGEGQFDSIDGRIMFTLDEIDEIEGDIKPELFELWLPQMVRDHPWFYEQRQRGYGSKRFRNLAVILNDVFSIKYADELTESDWQLLRDNDGLTSEREDWKPGIYSVVKEVASLTGNITHLSVSEDVSSAAKDIMGLANDSKLYFSTHRAYKKDWFIQASLKIKDLPDGSVVLFPRIPGKLLIDIDGEKRVTIIPAEECTKAHLLLLRQLHKHGPSKKAIVVKK